MVTEAIPVLFDEKAQMAAIAKAAQAGDIAEVLKLSADVSKHKKEIAENALKVKQEAVAKLNAKVRAPFARLAGILTMGATSDEVETFGKMVEKSILTDEEVKVIDGIWFSNDLSATADVAIELKLLKNTPKATRTGTATSSYKTCDIPTKDLLDKVGANIYLKEDTRVTIDKVEHTLPAGTTFADAYKYATNGGWRNRVVMAIRREAGVV